MNKINLKIPPQDLEAEKYVLGALMIDKDAIIKILDLLNPEDFYQDNHKIIFETILEFFNKNQPIDLLTIKTRLKEKKILTKIGGVNYLTEIINSVSTSAHITHFAQIVKNKKIRRDLIHISSEINEKAFESINDLEELLDDIEKKIFNITQKSRIQKFTHIKNELPAAYERLEKLHSGENKLRGLATHFTLLDDILSGLQKSELIVLGARPSLGKTAFALDIARNVSLQGHAVGIFSLEMSKDQIIDRLIAAQAQVPLWRLRTGRLKLTNDLEFTLIKNALDELSKAPIFIDDTPSPNIMEIRSMARKLQIENGLELLIIDYLQLIQPRTNAESLVQQITEISRGLKSLARELNIPILALSQLSRDVEKRESKIPRLSDLRESGSIEQDSDVVLFIYRKDRDKLEINEEEENLAEIIIAKNRNGPLGTIKLKFDSEKVTFRNIDTIHTEEEF